MFWHLLHHFMAGGIWKRFVIFKAMQAGWTHVELARIAALAHILNVVIPITIAIVILKFFIQS